MPNKKDLEKKFGISDNTVYKTLKACGLDTSREEYSDEEIENQFFVARQMLDSGKRYKDVEAYFGLNDSGGSEDNEPSQQSQQSATSSSAADAVGVAAAEMAVDMVQDAVKKISPHIPNLIAHTLVEEMRSPEMKTAFNNMRSEMKQQKNNTSNAGVDFLLKKMNNSGAKQLTGGNQNQAQLPEASPTDSEGK